MIVKKFSCKYRNDPLHMCFVLLFFAFTQYMYLCSVFVDKNLEIWILHNRLTKIQVNIQIWIRNYWKHLPVCMYMMYIHEIAFVVDILFWSIFQFSLLNALAIKSMTNGMTLVSPSSASLLYIAAFHCLLHIVFISPICFDLLMIKQNHDRLLTNNLCHQGRYGFVVVPINGVSWFELRYHRSHKPNTLK
jgi:hypothetical protein